MDMAIELAAKIDYESWGGSWANAIEDRKWQARRLMLKIFEAIKDDSQARFELEDFLYVDPFLPGDSNE